MTGLLGLPTGDLALLAAIAFCAGLVRGFTGFALSALVMASATTILPPVALIPICWWLEMTASLLMVRGGWAEADRPAATRLFIGAAFGVPLGLLVTTLLDPAQSRLVALTLLIALALTQMARLRLPALATPPGTLASGLAAGVATGLAAIGGMVVALYVLARQAPARQMRATLVLYLFLASPITLLVLLAYGVMDTAAALRGAALALPCGAGVLLGRRLFLPRWEYLYRPVCLSLLIGLAAFSLVRAAL